MESVFLNGGVIGSTMDFTSNEKYIVGQTQGYLRPSLVGVQTYNRAGSTSATSIPFNLVGGISTAPQPGDIVILVIALGAVGTTLMSPPAGYTQVAHFASNDTYDSILYVGYKIMGSTVDSTFPIPSSLSTANSQMALIFVCRGVDSNTPMDVTRTTAAGANGRLATPPAITPVTENAIIIGIGATAYAGTVYPFSSVGNLTGGVYTTGSDTYDGALAAGYHEWVSGTFTPTSFSIIGSTASDSWAAVSIALRPALVDVPVYGNYKNSGVWGLQSTLEAANKNIPNNIPGLQLWLDATDSSSLTYYSGNNIYSWKDKKNNVVYTTSSASIPTLTSANGLSKPAVTFPNNTISYMMTSVPLPISTPQTIFFVAAWYNVISGYRSLGILTNSTSNALQGATGAPYAVLYTSTGAVGKPQIYTSAGGYADTTTGVAEDDASIVEVIFNTTINTSEFTIDGIEAVKSAVQVGAVPSTTSYTTIGSSDTLYRAGGAFGEILIYEGVLTTEQRLTIRKYLQAKWGANPL
jgi:hypothetical protein